LILIMINVAKPFIIPSRRSLIVGGAAALLVPPPLVRAQVIGEGVQSTVKSSGGWVTKIPQTGLQFAWPFDNANSVFGSGGHANDPIGGKNAAFGTGGAAVAAFGSGPTASLTQAGSFNGASTATTSWQGVPTGTATAFTFLTWLYPTSVASGNPRLYANGNPGSAGFDALLGNGSATYQPYVGNGTSQAFTFGFTVSLNVWTLIAFGFDGTALHNSSNGGNWDGITSQTFTGPIVPTASNFSIGYNSYYNGDFFTGALCGFAFYGGVYFTNAQLAAFYTT
jgi:Concanavalin A-like lectin/glucanases superfamily